MTDASTMKRGTCSKCRSGEVYVNDRDWGQSGSYQNNTLPITVFTSVVLKNYVCTQCGYMESYVEEEVKLKKIKEKWTKASSRQRS